MMKINGMNRDVGTFQFMDATGTVCFRIPGVLKILLPKISYNYDPLLKLAVVFFLDLIA